MPANLSPEYEKAEQRYRQATADADRLAALEEMLATIPKHKGTEKMQADIKRRLSQLRKEQQKTGHAKGPDPFHIPRSGAGQVVLIGPPNSGKSRLLAATTNADARVADYPFTTAVPQPGMWVRDGIPIELVDTPPLTPEHVTPGLLGTIRNADVICLVVEAGPAILEHTEALLELLESRGLDLATRRRPELDPDQPHRRTALIVVNKAEIAPEATAATLASLYTGRLEVLAVSAVTRQGFDAWFARLWDLLAVIRVFAKQPGRPADLEKPFVLPEGSTVADLARAIHRDLPGTMKFARLWGHGRFEGQHVHKTEVLRDRDVVEIHE